MIKILYLHILQADSTENWNAFCRLIVLDNYKISKKSKTSVLRCIENITGSVGNFVKCIVYVSVAAKEHSLCYNYTSINLIGKTNTSNKHDRMFLFHLPQAVYVT